MKNNRGFKLLILVLGVLVTAGAALLISSIVSKNETPTEASVQETYPVMVLGDARVVHLEWTLKDHPDTVYSFTKDERERWHYDPDPSFNVDHTALASLVGYTRTTNGYRKIESRDLPGMGLEPPAGTIRITLESGEVRTLVYGSMTSSGEYQYGMNGDGNVYLLKNTVFRYFNKPLSDFEDVEGKYTEAATE
ncbi:MAG: DUF4340 domain-containing protein [Lachnospiraceae bacterium]|nr:DUF4340 domain-containing protein [Lachnospiraceae bacterium]